MLTNQDVSDVSSIIHNGADFISMAFVETAQEVNELRELLAKKGRNIKVYAQIQNQIAIMNY